MSKTKCFLHNPGVISSILEAILAGGMEEAKRLGADHGTMTASIVIDGKLHLSAQALRGDVTKENNPDRKWDNDPNVGINYVGFSIGKVTQSIRTGDLSDKGKALGYGESDSPGSYFEICFCRDSDNNEITFQLLAAYSGMKPEEDLQIAQIACRSGWIKLSDSDYQNPNGSNIHLSRIASDCVC